MALVLRWLGWLVAAAAVAVLGIEVLRLDPGVVPVLGGGLGLAIAYVVVHEFPRPHVREALATRRRHRRTRRLHLRWARRGRLPQVAAYADPRELDARGQVEYRVGVDRPLPDRQHIPEYVPRDLDPLLDKCVAAGGLVVLEGPAVSGKTRAACAALERLPHGRRLVVPADPQGLRRLAESGDTLDRAVVFLDDLELYLAEGGLDAHVLERLRPTRRPGGLTVLATIRSEERVALESSAGGGQDGATDGGTDGGRARSTAQLLGEATFVTVPAHWSEAEFARAAETDDPLLDAAMANRHGLQITEYLAAAPLLHTRWRAAGDGRNPVGWAVVTAVLDARRCGYSGPIPRALLTALAPHYLSPHDLRWGAGESLDEGLAWAVAPVRGHAGCLLPAYDDSFEPFDHLVAARAEAAEMSGVPDPVWEVLADRMPVADVLAFARQAQSEGRLATAERVLAGSIRVHPTDVDLSAALGFVLAGVPERQDEAEDWLRRAAEAGHPGAMAALGKLLLADPERQDEAERWLRLASGEARSFLAAGAGGRGQFEQSWAEQSLTEQGVAEPGMMRGVAEPGIVEPGIVEPGLADQGTVERGLVERIGLEPGSAEPDLAGVGAAGPGATGAGAAVVAAAGAGVEVLSDDNGERTFEPETGFLEAALRSERSLLARVFGRSSEAAAERFGVRVQRTLEWLAERLRHRHLDVVDPDRLGPAWLPSRALERLLGPGLRLTTGLLDACVAMWLALGMSAVVVLGLDTASEPASEPWQTATAWLLGAVGLVVVARGLSGRGLPGRRLAGREYAERDRRRGHRPTGQAGARPLTATPPGIRYQAWGPVEVGWRWWAGRLGWLLAGAYVWAAAYLLARWLAGELAWPWLVLGLAALPVTAWYVIPAGRRRALRWWQPTTTKLEPYAPLYAEVGRAAVVSIVSGLSTAIAGGVLGLGAVRIFGETIAPAVLTTIVVAVAAGAALTAFLRNGGAVWLNHLATRFGAWRRGMTLHRRFFDVAAEREVLVRVPAGFSFSDAQTRRDLARTFRAHHPTR